MEKTTKLKNTLLELVLIYGKIKDTNSSGITHCCTCNRIAHWTNLSGGHFMPQSKGLSTKFELDNINAQCNSCNGKGNQGEQYKHGLYIDKRYGKGRADQLIKQANQLRKWRVVELEEEIEKVTNLIIKWYKKQNKTEKAQLLYYIKKNGKRKSEVRNLYNKILEI